jgi:plastocyanin
MTQKLRQNLRQKSRVPALALIAVALVASGTACGSSAKSTAPKEASPTASSAATITIRNFAFAPAMLKVEVGTTVTVKNADDTDHTVTADDGSFDTGTIAGGESATFTASKAGTIKFHCGIHNYMTGTIQVTG